MKAYYLNNFVLARFTDGDEPIRVRTEKLADWIYIIINELKYRKVTYSDKHSTTFDSYDAFCTLMNNIEKDIHAQKINEYTSRIIMKILVSNRNSIIALSETDDRFDIKMINGNLVVITY